jgi:hypothetical protein
MGWLRDFMAQAEIRSFGELARQALAHPEWPPDTKAQQRSLEAILGRLDRQEDLEWLTDRPGIQQVLAGLLNVTVAELRTTLVGTAGPKPTLSRFRFEDIRSARSLELAQEALPPTIPELLGSPSAWSRCCWIGVAGSGFGLVAHWLSARGLAQTRVVETVEELSQLPVSGAPLYVEIDASLVSRFRSEWKGVQPLCLAVETDPRGAASIAELDGFERLTSEPIEPCLEQVVDWILFRIADRSSALRTRLLDWLKAGPMQWGVIASLGDVLGFVGAHLESGNGIAAETNKRAWFVQWMQEHTVDLARERHRDAVRLRQVLPELLIDMAQAALVDESQSLLAKRSIDAWLALVPEQHRRGPDIDWLTTRLVSDNLAIRQADLERAATRLPPGAHRLVVALRELQLLRPTSATRFALRPHFIARLSHSIALDRLVESAACIWGEALLREHARRALLPRLEALAHRQPEALAEDVLEQVDIENPALVCACETSFVLIGLAVLRGEEVSESVATSLLKEQSALMVTDVCPWPAPRTLPSASSLQDSPGAFFLSAWALSERLPNGVKGIYAALDPWHLPIPDHWTFVLDSVETSLSAALRESPAWLLGAVRLLDRIRQFVGAEVGPEPRPHPIFAAGMLLDATELGVLEWTSVVELHRLAYGFGLLHLSIGARRQDPQQLASQFMDALWAAFCAAERPAHGNRIFHDLPAELASCASPETLARWLLDAESLPEDMLRRLPMPVWLAWVNERRRLKAANEPVAPWQHAPLSVLADALNNWAPADETIQRVVWARAPELAMAQIERERSKSPARAAQWLQVAQVTQAPSIADFAFRSQWLRSVAPMSVALRRLLHAAVTQRVPQWQLAYDCLNQLIVEQSRVAFDGT